MISLALTFAMVLLATGCASTPRVTDALGDWRQGRREAALAKARGEVERFRIGNHIAQPDVDACLAEVDRLLSDETPILLPGPTAAPPFGDHPGDPMSPGPSLDAGLRQDLASLGTTRTLRAVRVVQRLALARFANDLFIVIWRREPLTADGPLLASELTAMRSVAVKVATLRALEALR